MSNSRAINVAAAAVALLNSAPAQTAFAPFSFVAVRAYRPNIDLTQQKSALQVLVIPQALATTPFSRGIVDDHVSIDVGVWDWVDPDGEVTQADALMLLVEQIKQQLEAPGALVLTDAPKDCGWQGTDNDPIFDPALLQNNSIFASVSTFTYMTRRAR
ncbi:MAG: hypothetical protein KGL39_22570 [Patescibacteria group bacterium]|nr:hypothetical protein [Patescibacteria group bacterium]